MFNDETQEVETSENIDEQEVEETVDEVEDVSTESETDWKAEAKKWEAIARRKAKKAESVAPVAPTSIDADLADTVYRNHLSAHGLTTQDAQDKAFELAKKTGVSVTKLTQDADILAVLQAKEKAAKTKQAIAPGTGGSTVQKSDTSRLAASISQGKSIKDSDISGGQALELLGLKR